MTQPKDPKDPKDDSTYFGRYKQSTDPEERMGFLDHLMELRKRIMHSAMAIAICMVMCMFYYDVIINFLKQPIHHVNAVFKSNMEYRSMVKASGLNPDIDILTPISTEPMSTTMILMRVAIWCGFLIASPVVIFEIWQFVSPGLREREKAAIRPIFLLGILCFIGGAAFCYSFVAPSTFEFFVWLDLTVQTKPSYTLQKLLDLLVTFMIVFGASFEIPLVTAILARLGLLRPEWLTKHWRGTILGCFVLGAIISPAADLFSFMMMAGTLVILYVLSILLAKLLYPKDKAKLDRENDEYDRRMNE